jgi:hypothetical protein
MVMCLFRWTKKSQRFNPIPATRFKPRFSEYAHSGLNEDLFILMDPHFKSQNLEIGEGWKVIEMSLKISSTQGKHLQLNKTGNVYV